MIDKLSELNRVLLAVESLLGEEEGANYAAVVRQCESLVIEGRMPNHELAIAFAQELHFLSRNGDDLGITDQGRSFLGLNPNKLYELSSDQQRLLLRSCFL